MHTSHENFLAALEKCIPRRHYLLSWEENIKTDWWSYRVRLQGTSFTVRMMNEYDYTEFECRDSIKEAMRRYGVKLGDLKATR